MTELHLVAVHDSQTERMHFYVTDPKHRRDNTVSAMPCMQRCLVAVQCIASQT